MVVKARVGAEDLTMDLSIRRTRRRLPGRRRLVALVTSLVAGAAALLTAAHAAAETEYVHEVSITSADGCGDRPSMDFTKTIAGVPFTRAQHMWFGLNNLNRTKCTDYVLGGIHTRVYGIVGAHDTTAASWRGEVVLAVDGSTKAAVPVQLGTMVPVDLDVTGALRLRVTMRCTASCTLEGQPAHNLRVVRPVSFTDVPVTSPFWADIRWLSERGITDGYSDGTFRPGQSVQRQAVMAFLHRMQGQPPGNYPHPGFSDVPPDHPFAGAIAWAVASGVTTGYPDGTFRGGAPVQRQAVVAWLARLAGGPLPACTSAPFVDVPPGHPFCAHIAWAKAKGITAGNADGTFRGGDAISRQAMARFLRNAEPHV